MVEHCDSTSHADHCKDGPHANAHKMTCEHKAQDNSDRDIGQVKTVLRKSHTLADRIRDGLHNAVSGIRHDPHVQRHGGADPGQDDCNDQKDHPGSQLPGGSRSVRVKAGDHS